MKIDSIYYTYPSDLSCDAILKFTNNSNRTIALPKTFDLELIVTDSLDNIYKMDSKVIFEYVNLVSFKKSPKIKPHKSINTSVTEWRLKYFHLMTGKYYLVKYSMRTEYDKKLLRSFGKTVFHSKFQTIKIPPK